MSTVLGHAGLRSTALMTEAANCSPALMSWGFSSELFPKLGSTRLKKGSVPAAASEKKPLSTWTKVGGVAGGQVGEEKGAGQVGEVVLPRDAELVEHLEDGDGGTVAQ
jgi:hypothetical protein